MAKKKTAPDPAAAGEEGPSFEEALERLENIVEELEGGSLTLEQSIARYEEGVKLSRRLTHTLDQAEKRIERLTGEDGEPATVPAELDETGEEPEAPRSARVSERPADDDDRPPRVSERPAEGASPRRPSPPPPDELPF